MIAASILVLWDRLIDYIWWVAFLGGLVVGIYWIIEKVKEARALRRSQADPGPERRTIQSADQGVPPWED
jgi:tRNA-binding EMAP/Myf-like protein